MKIYIKQATIINPASRFHKAKKDILIENGKVTRIEDHIKVDSVDHIIESKDLHISASWVDLKANFCDPGNEHKEDLQSGIEVAESGGFGHVFVSADNQPVTDNKGQVKYIKNACIGSVVELHAIGSITESMNTEQLSEMYDMYQNGVRLFSDAKHFVNTGLMHRALLYTQNFDGLTVSFPQNSSIIGEGQINEGIASVKTGLKSIPDVGETIQIQRDLSLLEYTGGRLHFTGISLAKSVELIREAKSKGLQVTCDVHVGQLLYTEIDTLSFDTNYKVLPPYRTEMDRESLWDGLNDGTIDCIVSDHQPENIEEKEVEFDNAAFGSLGLQTFYSSLSSYFNKAHELILDKITAGPRYISGLPKVTVEIDEFADFTLFDPTVEWTFNDQTNRSKSKNSPLYNSKLIGSAVAVIRGERIKMNKPN